MASNMDKYVVFNNGSRMPIIGLGTWQASGEETEFAVEAALEAGYRHIDTAYMYQNETDVGKALRKWLDSGKLKREDLFIVTKLPPIGNRAEDVEKYLKRSLSALQLSYVDLYLIHNPVGMQERHDEIRPCDEDGNFLLDMSTDHISLWKAMEVQVDAGRTKSIGLSNFNARQIKRIVKSARIPPANLQIELNAYFQQRELVAFCKALDITVCAYAPLGSPGFKKFLEKHGREISEMTFHSPLKDPIVVNIAKKHKKTPAQVLLKHIVERGIAVVPKSTNPLRIKKNYQIFDFKLAAEDIEELDSLDKRAKGRMFGGAALSGFSDHPENPYDDPY